MITIPGAENARTSDLACWRWPAGSPRLVSLWDMLRVNADDFYLLTTVLHGFIEMARGESERYKRNPPDNLLVACKASWKGVSEFLDRLEPACKKLELNEAKEWIGRIRNMNIAIDNTNDVGAMSSNFFEHIHLDLAELPAFISKQFPTRLFMFVRPQFAAYAVDKPFGEKIHKRFPDLRQDIELAGKCLAYELPADCVFHLSRAAEGVLRMFADTVLRIPKPRKKKPGPPVKPSKQKKRKPLENMNFGDLIRFVDESLKAHGNSAFLHPKKKALIEKCQRANDRFDGIRTGWRNPISHGNAPSLSEAEAFLKGIKSLMGDLIQESLI